MVGVVGPEAMYNRKGNKETFVYMKKVPFGIKRNVKVEIAKDVQFIVHGYGSVSCV
jgi:hypothetical protein